MEDTVPPRHAHWSVGGGGASLGTAEKTERELEPYALVDIFLADVLVGRRGAAGGRRGTPQGGGGGGFSCCLAARWIWMEELVAGRLMGGGRWRLGRLSTAAQRRRCVVGMRFFSEGTEGDERCGVGK
jgi:hypothetical protein